MLTRNQKSTINTSGNLKSLINIQVGGNQVKSSSNSEKLRSTVYIEDETGEKVQGAYFLTMDSKHEVQRCFHIVRFYCNSLI
jgi:hypothetical protein